MKTRSIYYTIAFLAILGCSPSGGETDPVNGGGSNGGGTSGDDFSTWSIPIDQVIDGGPGRDGIPSIENPAFYQANDPRVNTYMQSDDLILGVVRGGEVRAYPHRILDWHEIVNDEISGAKFSVNYCPLTGSAFAWESKVGGQETTFGVSGLLYNTNLILYDRATNSNWSQLTLECVNGPSLGDVPKNLEILETDWDTWKTMYPNSKVLSNDQGISRDYSVYPYGPYKDDHDFFIFPLSNLNPALPNKQRVHAVLNGTTSKAYTFDKFVGGKVVKDVIGNKDILVVGNSNIIYSFELNNTHSSLTFTYDFNGSGHFFIDDEGNKWMITGEAIEGPRTGQKLKATNSFMSFWFALAIFYPNPQIYQ